MNAYGGLAALAPLDSSGTPPTGTVQFESRGVALILGDEPEVASRASNLAESLRVVVFAPGIQDVPVGPGVVAVGGRITSIDGHFGAFRAHASAAGGNSSDIGRFSPNTDGTFDLVLDLTSRPLIAKSVPPLGYFAPGADVQAADSAIQAMRSLVGRFTKPRYFLYTESLCAHGASGIRGCTRCLDVCSAGAIRSAGDRVEVDPFLCQGCAACSLACPTGALSIRAQSTRSLADSAEQAIAGRTDAPVLVIHTAGAREEVEALPAAAAPIEVSALPAFGEELWLWAL